MDDGPEGQDKKQDSLHGVRASPPCGHHRRSTSRLRWCCHIASQSHGELITRHRPISTCWRPYRNPQSVLTGTPRFCAHSRRRDTGSRMVVLVDRHRSTQAGSSSNLGPSVACFFTHQIHVPDRLLTEHRRISPRSSRVRRLRFSVARSVPSCSARSASCSHHPGHTCSSCTMTSTISARWCWRR